MNGLCVFVRIVFGTVVRSLTLFTVRVFVTPSIRSEVVRVTVTRSGAIVVAWTAMPLLRE